MMTLLARRANSHSIIATLLADETRA